LVFTFPELVQNLISYGKGIFPVFNLLQHLFLIMLVLHPDLIPVLSQCGSGSDPVPDLNPDPDLMTKNHKILWLKKNSAFLSNIAFFHLEASMKEVQATGEAFSSQKEHPRHQGIKFFTFSYFVGHFFTPGSGPADKNQCRSMRIRSTELPYTSHPLISNFHG
jgi:hypothetical protein